VSVGIGLVFESFLTNLQIVGLVLALVGGLTVVGGRITRTVSASKPDSPIESPKQARVCLQCGRLLYEGEKFIHCPICGEFLTKVEEVPPKTEADQTRM
jgi:hypothetical protein